MKLNRSLRPFWVLLAAGVFAAPCLAVAAAPTTVGESPGTVAGPGDDFPALERFLTLSDDQLDSIQKAVAKVRAMSPAERAALHAQLHAFRQLPEAKRAQVRAGWGWQNERDRDDWPAMMRSLPVAERAAIHTELQSLPPEDRPARKHELLEEWRKAESTP